MITQKYSVFVWDKNPGFSEIVVKEAKMGANLTLVFFQENCLLYLFILCDVRQGKAL